MAKKQSIWVSGIDVPVSPEIYRAYKDAEWRENNQRRSNARKEVSLDRLLESGHQFVCDELLENIIEDQQLLELLMKALHSLPEDDSALIHALFYEGMTESQYSQIIGVKQQTVHKKKRRILKNLKKIFE